MQKIKDSIILREDDYQILVPFLKDTRYITRGDVQNVTNLEAELKKAKLVTREDFPGDVVRLNSKIKIKELSKNKVMDITLVTPDKADIKERRISVMAPLVLP
jgi:regulator of nucleoside diphosphate kinase